MAHDRSLLIAGVALVFAVIASKAGGRFGIPALLIFLALGMVAGPHGVEILSLSNIDLAQGLGVFALIAILFSGGMDTDLKAARKVLGPALALSTAGVVIAAGLVGIFAHRILGFSNLEGLLLGATVASTDVAAVFTVLRSRNVKLKEGVGPVLELESALNDPMSVFLGIGFLGLITGAGQSMAALIPVFLLQMVLGTFLGWIAGKVAVWTINRIKLEYDGLYPVLTVGWVVLTYGVTQVVGGSGFLAAYVAGIVIGNENVIHRKSLVHFHDGIAWLMQIAMFLTMGLLVDPSELLKVAPYGLALSAFLVFVARPASVFACTIGTRFTAGEKLVVSWAGLRGAVPIILATYPLTAGIPSAKMIFNLVFFVVFSSVLLQGPTIPWVARRLRADLPFEKKYRFPIEFNPTRDLRSNLMELSVAVDSSAVGRSILELNLPKDSLVVLIQRREDVIVPRGGTQLESGDTLLVYAESGAVERVRAVFG